MAYDNSFYKMYEGYLAEPRVRKKHDFFITKLGPRYGFSVVDLGCGRAQEYRHKGFWGSYHGFDVNAEPEQGERIRIERLDYRAPEFLTRLKVLEDPGPDAFVSLFSSECTASASENTVLYETLFHKFPTLTQGLVAGFYYTKKRDINPVREAGDILSWQTVAIEQGTSSVYDELRMVSRVPSTLFGEDVVEVWRLLVRRDTHE